MDVPVIASLERTCAACPAQWEGALRDGRAVYVRYRWGLLRVGFGRDLSEAVRGRDFEMQVGDSLDGVMDEEEMLRHTRGIVVDGR